MSDSATPEAPQINSTIEAFGYPTSLIHQTPSWVVLLRPKQATLGSLILACKEPALALSAISATAKAEMPQLMSQCENLLQQSFGFEKINYLMLMMVDPHVHYHIIPRYSSEQSCALKALADTTFADAGWPALPRLDLATATSADQNAALVEFLQAQWAAVA